MLLLLAACAPPLFAMPPGPESYRAGYAAGCDAGYAAAGSPLAAVPDAAPPRADEPYRAGWDLGFDACQRSFERIRRVAASVLGPPF